ncbi:Phospholipase C [Actinomortierella ambigua]|nr:Phospholipase C [Actinomortierella ambigua]
MFGKLKRAISGWSIGKDKDDDRDTLRRSATSAKTHSLRPSKVDSVTKNDLNIRRKASSAVRHSLPARFRSVSSSTEAVVLPGTTLPKDDKPELTHVEAEILKQQEQQEQHVPLNSANVGKDLPPTPTTSTANLVPGRHGISRASTELSDLEPKRISIRRTASMQSAKNSSDSLPLDAAAANNGLLISNNSSGDTPRGDEDIIIFSSTPPVTIVRSASKNARGHHTAHNGSPDQGTPLSTSYGSNNQDSVVQWPRGSSAAARSQEHYLRTHRRTSTSSETSLSAFKDPAASSANASPAASSVGILPTAAGDRSSIGAHISHHHHQHNQLATTPPVGSTIRPEQNRVLPSRSTTALNSNPPTTGAVSTTDATPTGTATPPDTASHDLQQPHQTSPLASGDDTETDSDAVATAVEDASSAAAAGAAAVVLTAPVSVPVSASVSVPATGGTNTDNSLRHSKTKPLLDEATPLQGSPASVSSATLTPSTPPVPTASSSVPPLDDHAPLPAAPTSSQEAQKPVLSAAAQRQLANGIQMLKVSAKKQHSRTFKLDLEQGRILWESKKFGRINVEQIKELRRGKAARMYREQLRVKPELEERWLTVIYSAQGKYKALHLVAPTKDSYTDLITALEMMWTVKREVPDGLPQLQRKTNQWLREHWHDADKNDDSKLGFEEVVRLCHRLNINFSRKEIRRRFDQADTKKKGCLDFGSFTQFVKLLKERREINTVFYNSAASDSMTLEEFTKFMTDVQKTNFDKAHIKEIYGKHLDKTVEKFTVDSLTSFLLSSDNSIIAPKHQVVHQDMTQSISNYFISSSHNTYLLGHQLTGQSSIEGYIRALQNGCRCVELDCWDGADGQPVIYHGRTLTSKILFRDVIEAISTYAFVNSPYPLILSLEIHCDLEQQEIMARTMTQKLGSWLVVAPLGNNSESLPSPEEMMFKILIKSKVQSETEHQVESESESESERESEGEESVKVPKAKKAKIRIAKALSDITIYCQSRHWKGWSHEHCMPNKIISFSERVSLRHVKQSLQDYTNFNKTHLTRVYPAGFRINSTNYDPHQHWSAGCQVVALNYQNYDRGMQMNSAMFSLNGHCGYVLKPQPLRLAEGETCNHDPAPAFVKTYPVDVEIEIISAQQLPRPNEATSGDVVDPVCELELLVPGQPTHKVKTRHISDNGFNPVWNEPFKFRIDYEHHELVFFRFVVHDEDIKFSDLLSAYCISLDAMEQGYRHIQLLDPMGEKYLYSTLFVKINITPCSQPTSSLSQTRSDVSLASSSVSTTSSSASISMNGSSSAIAPSRAATVSHNSTTTTTTTTTTTAATSTSTTTTVATSTNTSSTIGTSAAGPGSTTTTTTATSTTKASSMQESLPSVPTKDITVMTSVVTPVSEANCPSSFASSAPPSSSQSPSSVEADKMHEQQQQQQQDSSKSNHSNEVSKENTTTTTSRTTLEKPTVMTTDLDRRSLPELPKQQPFEIEVPPTPPPK